MIAHLRGVLLEKHPGQAVVECGGVGYDVTISVTTYSALPDVGTAVTLRIYTHVREDALALFGFLSAQEKGLFEKLISVSGIGPKLAITVLSGLAAGDLVSIIRSGDVNQLVRVPGIGKKTAERIVLELRDKLEGLMGDPGAQPGKTAPAGAPKLSPLEEDVLSALVNLGCQRAAAEAAIRKAVAQGTSATGFDVLFRHALQLVR